MRSGRPEHAKIRVVWFRMVGPDPVQKALLGPLLVTRPYGWALAVLPADLRLLEAIEHLIRPLQKGLRACFLLRTRIPHC